MYIFKFADIGEGIHEGSVGEIFVKEGQKVSDGENLFLVETDKVTTEISSPTDGVISKILFKVGDTIHVGQELFHIDDGSSKNIASVKEVQKEIIEEPKEILKKAEAKTSGEQEGASVVGEVKISNNLLPIFSVKDDDNDKSNNVLISPIARMMAIKNDINIANVKGSGPLGRILKNDIENFLNKNSFNNQKNFTQKSDSIFPISQLRKTIANALKKSCESVAYTNLTCEIDVTDLWAFRNREKNNFLEKYNVKLTLLPFIVKAISLSMADHPLFNAIYDENKNEIILKGAINIGIAIDTKDGLIVPNIKNANILSIVEISNEITKLAKKARDKKIEMIDLKEGSFTISNYGSLGVKFGTPVIKYPELAIAGIGTLDTLIKKIDNNFIERNVFNLTVAADHRWIDGGDIARFIKTIKNYLENPLLMWI